MKTTMTMVIALTVAGAAIAQEQGFTRGNTIVSLGSANLDQGQPDRNNLGVQGNYFRQDGLGLHFDVAGVDSDVEDTGYVAVGASRDIGQGLRLKGMIGGSDSEFGYFPKYHVDAELEKDLGTASGIILRGGLSYSKYDNDTEEGRLRGHAVRYGSPLANGGYFVQQVGLSVSSSFDDGTTGGEASASVTYVDQSGWSAGLGIAGGRIAYDQELGAAVENDFWAIRPTFGYQVSKNTELFVRGEYVDTELYNLTGVTLGLNFTLN